MAGIKIIDLPVSETVGEECCIPIANPEMTGKITIEKLRNVLGSITIEKVWENASPTSEFPAQTISLDLSDYDYVDIYTRYSGSDTSENHTRIRVGCECDIVRFYYLTTANQTMGVRARNKVNVTDAGISFPVCQVRRVTDTVVDKNDGYIIPTKIIAFKEV